MYWKLIIPNVLENPSVLASSGMMLRGTTSYRLMEFGFKTILEFLVSAASDSETPGYKVMNSKKGEDVSLAETSEPQKVLCDVDKILFSFSFKRRIADYCKTFRCFKNNFTTRRK